MLFLKRPAVVTLLAALTVVDLVAPPPVAAQGAPFCRPGEVPAFTFGFAALKAQLGPIMGAPVECAHPNTANGDVLQQTTTGLSFWRKSSNTSTFTDGYNHWGLTPSGLVSWTGDSIDPPTMFVAAAPRESPESTVRSYYAAIGTRDFPAAWALLSPRQRATQEYGTWIDGHRNTRVVETPSVTTLSQSGDTASVEVTIVATDVDGTGVAIKTFWGTWDLVLMDGGWRLDAARIALVDEQRSTGARPGVPPISPATPSRDFDPTRYIGQGDHYNCSDFASQAQAQAVLRAEPNDPNRLDQGGVPGVACEDNPPPYDRNPVPRP